MTEERRIAICLSPPLVISLSAVYGWCSGRLEFARFLSSGKAMAPLTIFCFLLVSSVPLVCALPGRRWGNAFGAWCLGVTATLLSCAVIVSVHDLARVEPALQPLLVPRSILPLLSGLNTGSMSALTTLAFGLIAASLFIMAASKVISGIGNAFHVLASIAAFLDLFVSLVGLAIVLGFAFADPLLSGTVSLPTGLAFIFIGLGLCFLAGPQALPRRNFSGGGFEARLLAAFVPVAAFITIGEVSALALLRGAPGLSSVIAVISFAFLLFATFILVLWVSRELAIDFDGLLSERRKAEVGLAEALRGKDRLLGELNHRTRNSLQLVLGLVDLAGPVPDLQSTALLRERVAILALVHDELSRGGDLSSLSAQVFLERLAGLFSVKGGLSYTVSAGDFSLLFDVAAPLGILASEFDAIGRAALSAGWVAGSSQAPKATASAVTLGLDRCGESGFAFFYETNWACACEEDELDFARTVASHQLGAAVSCICADGRGLFRVEAGECSYERRI